MDPITIAAASGLRSRMESLDMLANNLANIGTPGFKMDREFYSLYRSEEAEAAAQTGLGPNQPVLPVIERHWTDFSQGSLSDTGNPTDLALSGKGFFSVDGPDGPLYTRIGSFRIDANGKLVTREGFELTTVEPRRIRADSALPVTLDPDGTVRQQGQALGQLKVVDVADTAALEHRPGAYFSLASPKAGSVTGSQAIVLQGKSEAANAGPAESAIRLVSIMRQFETLQRAVQVAGDMGRKSIEDVARVQN
jgi:flagellar basal-body rod protein FlgF